MSTTPVIVVADDVIATLAPLTRVLAAPVVLGGGWAVHCRLRMARSASRPTEDLDLILSRGLRPAGAALAAVGTVQDDPAHPCRLSGLPLLVDLLADGEWDPIAPVEIVVDEDDVALLIPPLAALLVRTSERVTLCNTGDDARVSVGLPTAGALLAAKVANFRLEHRPSAKQASDAEDVLRLTAAFGSLALASDLEAATPSERHVVATLLAQMGGSGLRAAARRAGYVVDDSELVDFGIGGLVGMLG